MKIKLNLLDAHMQQNILFVSAFFCFLILFAYMIFSAKESENKNQKSIEKIIEDHYYSQLNRTYKIFEIEICIVGRKKDNSAQRSISNDFQISLSFRGSFFN